jgi:bifunctional DNA-binding transcriptional regulator/antitoxin component of YhaV-PrlF toxin-antitoxin module
MAHVETTKMSSRGQVVIPEVLRQTLGFETGMKFIVFGSGDTIILKLISPPSESQFKTQLAEAQKAAKESGFKKSDLKGLIAEVRNKRKRK